MPYRPDLLVVANNMDAILAGVLLTLYISFVSMGLAMVVGLVVALMRISKVGPLSWAAGVYIQFFRGIPQYVFLLWLYYGVAMLTGINFQPIQAGIIALTLQYGGYLAEIFRAGIEAIGKGQSESALSVGLSRFQTYRYIILPQAFRIILPPTANMFIGMLKDSSLVSIIGVMELMRTTTVKSNLYFRPFEFFTVAALIYIALTFFFSTLVNRLEWRLKYSR